MKKITGIWLYALTGFILFFGACHKDTVEPVAINKYKNNEFKATVSVDGAAPFTFLSKGDHTLFATRTDVNGDKVAVFLGDYGNASLKLTLVNMIAKGTYAIDTNDSLQYSWCDYAIGSGYQLPSYSTAYANGSGTVTLDSLTTTYISGTFQAILPHDTGSTEVKVTSGSFKGRFMEH